MVFRIFLLATECFGYMRQVQKTGPLVNSELYVGWIAYWNNPRPVRYAGDIVRMMEHLLSLNASFNLFLFHGGTNFGLTSGATAVGLTLQHCNYKPQITSYDFTAPLDETGDPTEKYYAIQRVLRKAVIYEIHKNFKRFSSFVAHRSRNVRSFTMNSFSVLGVWLSTKNDWSRETRTRITEKVLYCLSCPSQNYSYKVVYDNNSHVVVKR